MVTATEASAWKYIGVAIITWSCKYKTWPDTNLSEPPLTTVVLVAFENKQTEQTNEWRNELTKKYYQYELDN